MAARIFQIEESPGHPYYGHTLLTKQFLREKHEELRNIRNRDLNLCELDREKFHYSKNEVLMHICKLWNEVIIDEMETITVVDPFNVEQLHTHEELAKYVKTENVINYPLFHRTDKRRENINLADFLHRRSLRFQDFTFSVLKADKSQHFPWCLECMALPDSPYHKIFECSSYQQCDSRRILTESIQHLETNFHLPLIFGIPENNTQFSNLATVTIQDILATEQMEDVNQIRDAFRTLVNFICEQSMFKDEYLTRANNMNANNGNMDESNM